MRVTSSPVAGVASDAGPPTASDRTARAPTGERFRTALRAAGNAEQAGDPAAPGAPGARDAPALAGPGAAPPGAPAQPRAPGPPGAADPADPIDLPAHVDDTMATTAAQAAYLARPGSATGAMPRARHARPTHPPAASAALDGADAMVAGGAPAAPGAVPDANAVDAAPSASGPSAPSAPSAALLIRTELTAPVGGRSDPAAGAVDAEPRHAGGVDTATIASVRTAYGLGSDGAPGTNPAARQLAPEPAADSPVDAWLASAVARTADSYTDATGSATGRSATASATTAAAGATEIAAPAPAAGRDLAAVALTPLEQAVHDLVEQLSGQDGVHTADREPVRGRASRLAGDTVIAATTTAPAPLTAGGSQHAFSVARESPAAMTTAPGHAPAASAAGQPPEPPANPSHVHLVIEDGPERVVATVAIRGSEVHVALRATDEATAAALARNAGSLDHAMRSRGLDLGQLTAEREPSDRPPSQDAEPRERRRHDAEPFELEEKP